MRFNAGFAEPSSVIGRGQENETREIPTTNTRKKGSSTGMSRLGGRQEK